MAMGTRIGEDAGAGLRVEELAGGGRRWTVDLAGVSEAALEALGRTLEELAEEFVRDGPATRVRAEVSAWREPPPRPARAGDLGLAETAA